MTSPHDTVLAMMARGREFLGTEYAIMGGAMSWISERNLVSAISANISRHLFTEFCLMSSTILW